MQELLKLVYYSLTIIIIGTSCMSKLYVGTIITGLQNVQPLPPYNIKSTDSIKCNIILQILKGIVD